MCPFRYFGVFQVILVFLVVKGTETDLSYASAIMNIGYQLCIRACLQESEWNITKYEQTLTYVWCTKRVNSTDTGRPVFQEYGSTRKFTGRPVFQIRVDPYFCGSTRIFSGRPVFLRVDPYNRADPYICGSTRIVTGRPVFYGSTCIYWSTRNIRVDPYFTGRPVS